MTIQPGPRIEAKTPHRAVAALGVSPFIPRKYAPPRFPPDLVGLNRAHDWLARLARHELAVVRAPAGYGKTAFCAALFEQARVAGWLAGWVSFDPEDNESAAIGPLFEAVRLARADGEERAGGGPASPETPAMLAAALAARIDADPRPLLLVLDDVDRLTDARAIEVLDRLVSHPPAQLRLVLVGRTLPVVAIGAAERRGMVLSVGRTDLALDDDAVRAFVLTAGAGSDARAAADINRLLEGWPAGVRLAGQAGPPDLARRIDAYLAPLIDGLPAPVRQLLQRSAVAPRIDADLCRLLGGGSDGEAMLRELCALGLFLDDEGDGWFRLHPAFRAALCRRRDTEEPGRAEQLHRAAARYFAAQGLVADAVDQALAAGDVDQASALIVDIAMPMIARGDIARLGAWFASLSPEQVAGTPGLARGSAWLSSLTARPQAVAAIDELAATGDAAEAQALAIFDRAFAGDRPDAVIETCDQLLASADRPSDFAVAMIRAAAAHGALKRGLFGLVHESIRPLVLRGAGEALDLPLALAICAKAGVARAQGQLREAERVLREASQLPSVQGLASALIDGGLARCHYERNEPEAAGTLAARALPLLEQGSFPDAVINAFLVTIRVAATLGQVDTAASLIDRAEHIAFDRGWVPLKALCIVERARLRLPPTIDAEAVVAIAEEEAAVIDPLSAPGRAFALLSEARAYEAIAQGDRPRLTMVAERLLQLASNADDAELRASATLFNILPQLSGRCDKMVELETVRFLNHAASVGFRRTIVDVLDVTGVRAVQNFCSEAYSSDCFLALLKLAEPSRHDPALEGTNVPAPGEAFSFLTEREIEILSALNAGESNKEIARTLQLAPETVKWHLKNIMRKLRATSRDEAVVNATTLGLKLIEAGAVR